MPKDDLAKLVRRAQRQDSQAFSELIRRYERLALSIGYAVLDDANLASDVAQESFLKAWQKLPELREPERFPAWLGQLVRNVALDERRRLRRAATETTGSQSMSEPRASTTADQSAMRSELTGQIDEALSYLDETSRCCVMLRYYEDMSSREIGDVLGLTPQAVDMRLSRARSQLRDQLSPLADSSWGSSASESA